MGTTRIKVIDLSGQQQEIKTSRKHAERLTAVAKLKEKKVSKVPEVPKVSEEKTIAESTIQPSEPSVIPKPPQSTKTPTRHQGKKYQTAAKLIDSSKVYPASEALALLGKTSYTKFDPTVEVHINVTDKNIRGSVNFPHAVGGKIKEKRYLIFSPQPSKSSAPSVITNSIIWANEKTITDIETGKLKPGRNFDQVIAHPKFMPQIAKIAKILGPAGMMPNPKNGTITDNPATTIDKSQSAGLEFKTDPIASIIHTQIGKLSAKPAQLEDNLQALITAIGPAKIRKAVVKSTMSPGIKINLQTLAKQT